MTETRAASTGADLAARLHDAWAPFRHGGVAGVGLGGLRRPAPSGWTYGGLVAHVAAWHDTTARRLDQFARTGKPAPPPPDVDAFNRAAAADAEGRRPSDLLEELDASFERLAAAVQPLTPEQVAANDGWAEAVLAGNSWDHYDEHREELRAARPTTVASLLERYDADWSVMRAAVQRLVDEGRLGDPASDAWRLRDVVAHINGWLLEALAVLPEYVARRPRQYTQEGIDARNMAVVEVRRGLPEPELVAELDEAGRNLRAALAGLRDEDVADRRTLGIVAACSYLHWDEHLTTLGADV